MPLHNNHASLINNTAPHIHDPAIVQDRDGSYAVFGTHRMFAHSDVLHGEAGVDDGPHIGPVAGEFLRHEQDDDRTQVVTVE